MAILMEEFSELTTESEWLRAFPILCNLRIDLTEDKFLKQRDTLIKDGYHLFGLSDHEQLVAVASANIYPHVTKGKNCWVHDLVTIEGERSKGYGKKIMQGIEAWAKSKGCSRLSVHTRIKNERAQHFYEKKLGYLKTAVTYSHEL